MQRQNILRTLLFVVFFSIGTAALVCSVLYGDLLRYYRGKKLLKLTEQSLDDLESLNADYDALLQRLEEDPNLFERIAPATLGTEPADANAVYPEVTAEQLNVARKVLAEGSRPSPSEVAVPGWIKWFSKPARRIILFLAGAFLILISFIFFGFARQ